MIINLEVQEIIVLKKNRFYGDAGIIILILRVVCVIMYC